MIFQELLSYCVGTNETFFLQTHFCLKSSSSSLHLFDCLWWPSAPAGPLKYMQKEQLQKK